MPIKRCDTGAQMTEDTDSIRVLGIGKSFYSLGWVSYRDTDDDEEVIMSQHHPR